MRIGSVARWTYRTIEFSSRVAASDLSLQLPPAAAAPSVATTIDRPPPALTHSVLPDLPDHVLPPAVRTEFRELVTPSSRIRTVAVSRSRTTDSLLRRVRSDLLLDEHDDDNDDEHEHDHSKTTLLVVGGNDETTNDARAALDSSEAVRCLSSSFSLPRAEIWCVWDPDHDDDDGGGGLPDRLRAKLDAGATGVVTQPPLTGRAWDNLARAAPELRAAGAHLVVGAAFPTSVRSLRFWARLLKNDAETVENDALFRDHVAYFSSLPAASASSSSSRSDDLAYEWARREQRDRIMELGDGVSGVHLMPLNNVRGALRFLQDEQL